MLISRMDAKLHFGESGAYGNAGTFASANVIQMDKAQPGRMRVEIKQTVAATAGTSVVFAVQGSNDNSTYVTVEESPTVLTASLTAGAKFSVAVPPSFNYKYMRVAAIGTGNFTAGKFDAWLDVYQGA
jgi:uncharacterized protein YjdB